MLLLVDRAWKFTILMTFCSSTMYNIPSKNCNQIVENPTSRNSTRIFFGQILFALIILATAQQMSNDSNVIVHRNQHARDPIHAIARTIR